MPPPGTRQEESAISQELPSQRPEHLLYEHGGPGEEGEDAGGQEVEEAVGGQEDVEECAKIQPSVIGKQMSSMGIKEVNRELKSRGIPKHEIKDIKKERRKVKNRKYSKGNRVTVKDLENLEKIVSLKVAQDKNEYDDLRIEHKILDVILQGLRQYSFHMKSKWEDPSWEKSDKDQRFMELITGFDRQLIKDCILRSKAMWSNANNEMTNDSVVSGDLDTKGSPKRKSGGYKGVDPEEYLRQNLSQVWESSSVVLK